ncbi:hemoglobin [Deinobacterium chartae]|uniref:Hemoglobin n=1 Tax=Deinobacterium chartae TaxID=521158 RepID=A0A841I0C3_9DEIO|nr:globin [Deinobacterium chartae]MBB6098414.1 hemoglobin [Deinobacterium chartae]
MQLQPIEYATLYDRIGAVRLRRLLEDFYARVALNPDIAPLFPEDLSETIDRQEAFMTGFFGGPPLYFERYGHPRLRMRHMRFPIGQTQARAWLACMHAALEASDLEPDLQREVYAALARTAVHMINQPGA